jgi:rubrerythrin
MTEPIFPYDMFELDRSAEEARRFDRMRTIYDRGQALAWNGAEVLEQIVAKHGGVRLDGRTVEALDRVYAPIMWGELAAWRVAAQLADRIEPLEAKMAATSQAHDEARHFWVLHEYLSRATGRRPGRVHRAGERLLGLVVRTNDLPKKLVGMQLQVETTALTIFQASREAAFCPVLADLLRYFEKDEARHVGLGTQYLPMLVRRLGPIERADFLAFQLRVIYWSLASLRTVEGELRELGIDPRRLVRLGKSKMQMVYDELWSAVPGSKSMLADGIARVMEAATEAVWPHESTPPTLSGRVGAVLRTLRDGVPVEATHIAPPS